MKNTLGFLILANILYVQSIFAAPSFYEVDPSSITIEAIDEDPGATAQAILNYKKNILLQKRDLLAQKNIQTQLSNAQSPHSLSLKKSAGLDEVNQSLEKVEVATDTIIRTGTKIWNVLEKGKPIINLQSKSASAVPLGINNWFELESWKAPKSQTYQITYKNHFGYTLMDFKFRVIFMYGGSYKGKGQYIANAQILPVKIYTFWLCDFNVQSVISEPYNMGTTEDPIASMQLAINWQVGTVKSILQLEQNVENFFITGDGQITRND